jgi:restriction endonuclease
LKANCTELRELSNVYVEESEKDHVEQIRDEIYRKYNSQIGQKERIANEIRSVSYLFDSKVDDFGVETAWEGYDSLEDEDLIHYTATSKFRKESMDLLYEQDMSNYPDAFKIYGENYKRSDEIRSNFERSYRATNESNRKSDILAERPGAMRAWISKWDPDYNVTFKSQGTTMENTQ